MLEKINYQRRHFLSIAGMTIAATQLGRFSSAKAQASQTKPIAPSMMKLGTTTSFGSLKQIDAGVLKVGYAEVGSTNGRPVILLHGWPYDIHSYVGVAPLLASDGYRVIFRNGAGPCWIRTISA